MSGQRVPAFKSLRRSRDHRVPFPVSQNRRAAQLRLPGGKSLGPGARGCCSWLRARHCSLITFQRASGPGMSALGGPHIQPSAPNLPLSVENCRFLLRAQERAQVNTKALISILCANNNPGSRFPRAHKRLSEEVWRCKAVRCGGGWFPRLRAGILFYFSNSREQRSTVSPTDG